MPRLRPLHCARLAAVLGLLALLAAAANAKTAAAPKAGASAKAAASPAADNAPFWTGHPDAAQLKARTEKRRAQAKSAMDRMLAVTGTHSSANTLGSFDERPRQLDRPGSHCGLMEEA